MMDGLSETIKEYELKVNTKETKVMKISGEEGAVKNMKITIDGEKIDRSLHSVT